MTSHHPKIDALLRAVGTEIGTPLELDDDNECILSRADGQEIVMIASGDSDALIVMAPLVAAGPANRAALFAWLLERNFEDDLTRGTTLGMDRASDMLMLRYRLPVEGLTGAGLAGILSNLFSVIDELMSAIAEQRQALASGGPETAPSSPGLATPFLTQHDLA
jgi:Tir chaperone protein (CesT) family